MWPNNNVVVNVAAKASQIVYRTPEAFGDKTGLKKQTQWQGLSTNVAWELLSRVLVTKSSLRRLQDPRHPAGIRVTKPLI